MSCRFFCDTVAASSNFARQQGNGIENPDGIPAPLGLDGRGLGIRNSRNPPDHFNGGFQVADVKRDESGQHGHLHLGRITRSQFQLTRDALNIGMTPFEINVLTGEWPQFFKLWVDGQIVFRPIVDRLTANEDIRLSICIAYLENFRKLLEGKTHGYAHRAMARAT